MGPFLKRYRGPLLIFLGGVVLAAVAVLSDRGTVHPPPAPPEEPAAQDNAMFNYPGVRQPPTVPAAAARLGDGEQVVGVVAGGKARAYAVRALKGKVYNHVVNDLVGGVPVTVTYSDLGSPVQLFTGGGREPLDVRIAGVRDGQMALKVENQFYSQQTGQPLDPGLPGHISFEPMKFERTTWKKWREAHPDTDVYLEPPENPDYYAKP